MPPIPYERQRDTPGTRRCGAAALNMVYRSFGLDQRQEDVWSRVASADGRAGAFTRTHDLVRDALQQGFQAVAFNARNPIAAAARALDSGARVIWLHRLNETNPAGHFTVPLRITDRDVIYHDPVVGGGQKRVVSAVVELFQPEATLNEVRGRFLIVISNVAVTFGPCAECGGGPMTDTPCASCQRPVPLRPLAALACTNGLCESRLWEGIACPWCGKRADEAPARAASLAT